jgi:hypothetical protein
VGRRAEQVIGDDLVFASYSGLDGAAEDVGGAGASSSSIVALSSLISLQRVGPAAQSRGILRKGFGP